MKVKFIGGSQEQVSNAYCSGDDPIQLARGEVYTVRGREIRDFCTLIELDMLPGLWFNSVLFKEVK